MAPHTKLTLWYLTIYVLIMLPGMVKGQFSQNRDSLDILSKDSIAFNLYLTKPDSAVGIALDGLTRSTELNYKSLQGLNYYILSKAYWAKANFSLSAEYGFKSLKIFENTAQFTMWGKSLLSLARVFIDLHNYDQASVFIERAIRLGSAHHDQFVLAEGFREKSMLFSELKQYDSALSYSDRGIKLYEMLKDTLSISILYGRKAKIYIVLKDYKKSNYYNKKSIHYDSLVGNRRALGIGYYLAALGLFHQDKSDSAVFFLKKSIPINKEIRNIAALIKAHTLLSDIYLDSKNAEFAVRELKIASLYKDSLYNTEKSGQIQEMQSLYELSSKEKTIEQLAQDNSYQQQQVTNQRWYVGFLLVCVLALAVGIFLLTRYRRLQEKTNSELGLKNRAIEQQKEEILAQSETLHQLNNLKSKLFSVISHDLRGPMATLHSLLDLLSRNQLSPDEFVHFAEKLKNNMDVTQRTLENLLNWSLSQMEGIRTEAKVINVKYSIREVCNLMSEVAQLKSVAIHNQIEGELLVSADSNQFHLILRNLIHNAIKFSNPLDTVLISAVKEMDFCLITVKDNGIGMTEEELKKVLGSPNYFSKVGTQQEKGTGLGLLLCKEFIKLNGGEMTVRSAVNKGTEVEFTVPLAGKHTTSRSEVLVN